VLLERSEMHTALIRSLSACSEHNRPEIEVPTEH
ncbi:MAG: hypothetical protein ACI9A8_001966, partial [Cryomorphaceae bacterium]